MEYSCEVIGCPRKTAPGSGPGICPFHFGRWVEYLSWVESPISDPEFLKQQFMKRMIRLEQETIERNKGDFSPDVGKA